MKKFGIVILLFFAGCKEYYEPPALKNSPDFLVVDGFLNSTPDSTHIRLTHTRNLADTAQGTPELNASLVVDGDQGTLIPLTEIGNGLYGNLTSLRTSEKYRLSIHTASGKEYRSEFVPFKQTPAVDSLTWEEDSLGVNFFVNTHDPQNSTIYYRWQFEETWQYDTYLVSNFDLINDTVVRRNEDQQIHSCWKTNPSPTILLASTNRLSKDIVSHFLFNNVSKSTEKIYVQYSVQISQYALTKDEFDYWTLLKKNSEQLGTLFDAQPTQLNSNIHCLTNPDEPVMGYLSASTVQKKRIFVTIYQLSNYNYVPYSLPCHKLSDVTTAMSPYDLSRAYEYLEMPGHLFTFWYNDGVYHLAQNFCIDCREHGGTNVKPNFWP
jgi:hypothetical protein